MRLIFAILTWKIAFAEQEISQASSDFLTIQSEASNILVLSYQNFFSLIKFRMCIERGVANAQ